MTLDRPERAEHLADLAHRAGLGDRSAFEQLVIETTPELYALSYRLVGNEHDARDVVQETYLRAFRSISTFRGDAAVTTWLSRIVANRAATLLSRRARRADIAIEEDLAVFEPKAEAAFDAIITSSDERSRLIDALALLPNSLRMVVVLHDIYDLSHASIASELKITRAASKVRLHRARRILREALDHEEVRKPARRASDRGIAHLPIALDPPAVGRRVRVRRVAVG